jgi:hypothetical protein
VSGEGLGFPVSAEEVTPAWLTDVLRSSGAIGVGHEVATVAVSRLGVGAGFMGSVERLTLTYSGEPGAVSSVVVKSAAPDPEMRELVRGYRNYEREVGFFRDVAGELGDGVPRCYAAQIDGPSNHFVLVLEDLSAGFRDGDQVAGATAREARDCLDVQAELHARYWHARARRDLDWVLRVDGDFFVPTMRAAFVPGWAGITERFPELVPEGLRELGPGFADHVPALARRLAQCPQTLVHSDFRLDNLMFAREPGALPVKVLDWQGILVSAGVHDVAFLLSQNLADGVREAHERELVEHYHRALVGHGIDDYPLARLWDDYRVAVLLEWVYAAIIGGTLPMADERSRALFAAMVGRSGQAIVDLDALSLLESLPH